MGWELSGYIWLFSHARWPGASSGCLGSGLYGGAEKDVLVWHICTSFVQVETRSTPGAG